MFSNRIRALLALMLVLLLTCSFTIFANAADTSGNVSTVSATNEVSDNTSTQSATSDISSATTTSDDVSVESVASTISTDSSDASAAAATTGNKWTGLIIAGIVLLILAVTIFVSIKKNNALGQRLVKMFKDYKSEIKKIVWLSRKETMRQTGIVLVIIIFGAVILGGLDWAFTKLIQLI